MFVRWHGNDPVDVYLTANPDGSFQAARRMTKADRDGEFIVEPLPPFRPYFLLRPEHSSDALRVAERLLPLQHGSNFRDVGGYPASGGKHVRWGRIYRAAATPLLSGPGIRYLSRLGITTIVDLRSVEERQLAPDRLGPQVGARYFAVDYPAGDVFTNLSPNPAPPANQGSTISALYRAWPKSLAPQFREIFRTLSKQKGAIEIHCSAGQDRTGVATALVLSALGVPREVILADYHLSTRDRSPDNELPPIDPALYPGNTVAAFFARAQASGALTHSKPLYDETGVAYLQQTFDAIQTQWGSVDNYLSQELGMDGAAIARLRALYLE
jgi:protein-tyrosine phosphatase